MTISNAAASGAVRARLISAAGRLFYAEGIHAVGIDRVLAEAGVAKASLYHHFGSKDDLVVAYLESRSEAMDRSLRELLTGAPPDAHARLEVIFEGVWTSAGAAGFRGCPFINAAAEYPHADHPVRGAVTAHRRRFADLIGEQLSRDGSEPEQALVESVAMAYDGCMVAAQMDSAGVARRAGQRALDVLVAPAA